MIERRRKRRKTKLQSGEQKKFRQHNYRQKNGQPGKIYIKSAICHKK